MFFWRQTKLPGGKLCDWIVANQQQIHDGTASYMGTPVTEMTVLYRYRYVISLGVVTLIFETPLSLPTKVNGYLRTAWWDYSLITFLFGWWCIPWGPLFVFHAILVNLSGGRKRTVASLLQITEWGWEAPHEVSIGAHKKKILELSDSAAEEIRSRMERGGYSDELAVRITPTKWADAEVEISFDFAVSDGRDWTDESQGLLLIIDKRYERQLSGSLLGFDDGRFYVTTSPSVQ